MTASNERRRFQKKWPHLQGHVIEKENFQEKNK